MKIRVGNFSNEISDAQFNDAGVFGPILPANVIAQRAIIGPRLFGFSPEEANASIDDRDPNVKNAKPQAGGRRA